MRPNLIATGPGGGKPADRAHSRGVVGVAVFKWWAGVGGLRQK
jgi:hypothetical protein